MEITVKDFLDSGTTQNFAQQVFTTELKQVKADKQGLGQIVTSFLEEVSDNKQHLAQVSLVIDATVPMTLYLETGIINLAFKDIKRVDNFFSDESESVPLNVYISFEAEGLNASNYRIDKLIDLDKAVANPAKLLELVLAKFKDYLEMLATNQSEDKAE